MSTVQVPPYDTPQQAEGYNPAPATFDTVGSTNTTEQPATGGYQPTPAVQYNPQCAQKQSSNVVVVGNQPSPMVAVASVPRSQGDNFLTLSIVMTVLCIAFCQCHNLICTIPAILYAIKARDAEQLGDIQTAKSHAKVALILNIVSVVVAVVYGIVVTIVTIATVVVLFAAAADCNEHYSYYREETYYTC